MNLEFKDKYLKYKKKYLELKDLMAGGESKLSPLTPEQERANAFFKVMDFIEFVDKKDTIFVNKDSLDSKVDDDVIQGLKKDEKMLASYKKSLQAIDDEIDKENKKIVKTGKKLKQFKEARQKYNTYVVNVYEAAVNKFKEAVEYREKLVIPALKNVVDAKNKFHENLNQNLEKYFKIDIKNRIHIVKIKEINSLFDAILSYKEVLDKYIKIKNNPPKPVEKEDWLKEYFKAEREFNNDAFFMMHSLNKELKELKIDDFAYGELYRHSGYSCRDSDSCRRTDRNHYHPFKGGPIGVDLILDLPGVDLSDNLITFKNDYLNKESKKYIDSDITYDRKTLEDNEPFYKLLMIDTPPRGRYTEAGIEIIRDRKIDDEIVKPFIEDFDKIPLGDVKIQDKHGSEATLTPHIHIPKINLKTCPFDIPYCTDFLKVLKEIEEIYPENKVSVTRKQHKLVKETEIYLASELLLKDENGERIELNDVLKKHGIDPFYFQGYSSLGGGKDYYKGYNNMRGGKGGNRADRLAWQQHQRMIEERGEVQTKKPRWERVTDLRFISDETMKKLIQEKLKDPKLSENQKKLFDRPYHRSSDDYNGYNEFTEKFEQNYNRTLYKEV